MQVEKLPSNLYSFIWHFIKGRKFTFFLMLFSMSAWAIQESVYPYFIKLIIDKITELSNNKQQIFTHLNPILFGAVLTAIFIEIGFRINDFVYAYFMPKFRADVRDKMFDYVKHHSHTYYAEKFSGTIASKITRMPEFLERILDMFMTIFFPVILSMFISFIVLFSSKPIFGIIMLVWIIMHFAITLLFAGKCQKLASIQSDKVTILNGKIVDALSNIVNIRLFNRLSYESKYLKKYQDREVEAAYNADFYNAISRVFLGIIGWIFTLSMVFVGIYSWRQDYISLGDLVLVLSYQNLIGLVWYMSENILLFYECIGNANDCMSIINDKIDIQDSVDAKILNVTDGEIIFKNVTFNYIKNDNIFKDKSVTINSKEKVGLVGFSGSGKTTFVNLILRYFDISNGQILIDGQDISKVTQGSLREQISMIPQDSILFHRSIIENIRYGKLDVSDEEVIKAAKRAYAHDFIMKLENGYDTCVGERGIKLSGGQRQRLSIARAILKNAPILILDEATSALDSVTEKQIQESISTLMEGKTVLVVAHRLSTLLDMDRILVFDKGHIVEDGTHFELLEKKGHYYRLWSMQGGGFLPQNLE